MRKTRAVKPIDTFFCPLLYCAGVFAVPWDLEVPCRMPSDSPLAEVWEQKKPILRAIAKTILFDHSLIDDVLQDAYAGILATGREFRSEDEAYSYARRAVTNTAIDYYRHIRTNTAVQAEARLSAETLDTRTPLMRLVGSEDARRHQAVLVEVRTAVESLSPERKQAVDVVFVHRRKLKDVCKETGIPYSTLRSRALAAIDEIREHLRSRGFLSPIQKADE